MFTTWKFRETNLLTILFLLIITTSFALVGCKNDGENGGDQADGNSAATTPEFPQFMREIRSLDDATLNALGAKNDLPTEFVAPGAYYAQVIFPDKIRDFSGGDDVVEYFAQNALEIPVEGALEQSELVLTSKGFSFEALKNAKDDSVLQEGFPSPVDAVYMRSKTPYDKEAISNFVFEKADKSKLKKVTFGSYEVQVFENTLVMPLDQSGQDVGKIEKICAGLCFPTDNSIVFLSGAYSFFEEYFSALDGDARGIAAQRIARADVDRASVVYEYEYDFSIPNAQLVLLPIRITNELMASVQQNVSAFQIFFAADANVDDLLTITINAKSPEGAQDVRKQLGTALMQAVDSINEELKKSQNPENSTAPKLVELLKSLQVVEKDSNVVATIKNTEDAQKFIVEQVTAINTMRRSSELYQKYQGVEQALRQFGSAFTRYSRENKKFPAPICAEDGTPLLSWRVALLPAFGAQYKELYEQFKLDEPWNSENNLKLLDKMPPLYATSSDPAMKTKTRFLIFNSPDTPFGKAGGKGLTLQDVDNPYDTISVFCANEKEAIEWTKPEAIVFNPEKPTDSFGEYVCAVTLMGEIISAACSDEEATAKSLATLVYGLTPTSEEKPAEDPQTTPEENASPESQTPSAPDNSEETSTSQEPVAEEAPAVEAPAE